MLASKLEQFRKQLLDMGKRLEGDVAELARETSEAPSRRARGPDDGPDGTMTQLEQDMSLMINEQAIRDEIADALARIDAGSFGKCESCGSAICEASLQALPFAKDCIERARK